MNDPLSAGMGRRDLLRVLVFGASAATTAACVPLVAAASLMRFLSIEEMATESSLVVRARIASQSTHWTANHEGIYTRIEAVALGSLKGLPAGGQRLEIIQAGGEIDGVSLDWSGRPTFQEGEDLILFLQPYEPSSPADERYLIVGGKQGRMRVKADPRNGSPVAAA